MNWAKGGNRLADNHRKQLVGQVLESKMQKTAIVRIDTRSAHPVYKKYLTQSKKYYVHDPENQCNQRDIVSIIECHPKSRLKRWRLNRIVQKAAEV